MKLYNLCVAIAIMISSVAGQDIEYVGHKEIEPITSNLGGVGYNAYRSYQPAIKVLNGCVPFPAVGEYKASAGLKLGGARNGLCSSSPGQAYARHKDFPSNKVRGIMYAYYFPKDQVFAGISAGKGAGHRHDWEEVIVWVTWDWKRPLGASMSGHGEYTHSRNHWNGSHKSVLYANGNTIEGISHEFRTSGTSEGFFEHPLANWYQLSEAVRYTLNNAEWRDQQGKNSATPKIVDWKVGEAKNSKFEEKMNQAFEGFF